MSDSEREGEELPLEPESKPARKRVKVEGGGSAAWVDPLYAEQPTITWDRVSVLKRDYFEKKFGLCNEGFAPKRLRFGVHLDEADVEGLFGPKVNANGYRYSMSEDIALVERVEKCWMITHQRSSIPNSRLINVAEAKGHTYEIVKGKKTNWCLHAEWTCREQLRRLNLERDAAQQQRKGADLEKKPGESVTVTEGGEGDPSAIALTQPISSGIGLEHKGDHLSMTIGEWQEYLSLLDREAPLLDQLVKVCAEKMDAAKLELVKVSTQTDYGRSLLVAAETRLRALEAEVSAADVRLQLVKSEDLDNTTAIEVAEEGVGDAKRKVDAQAGVIDQMRMLFGSGESGYEEASLKFRLAEEAYTNTSSKQELWRRHRVVLLGQLRAMKAGLGRPACFPTPLPFLYLDCDQISVDSVTIAIAACPFCTRGFDPSWDCKFASCQHAYHSWCAYSHFSSSTKCMFKDCNQEMHEDWWTMAGIKKPSADKGKDELLGFWEISENLSKDFPGLNTFHRMKCEWLKI